MSNEKNRNVAQCDTRLRPARGIARKPLERGREVEVIALEIADDLDPGGDPYNHTGSHCVVKIRED